jgi:hypothetical protein
VLGTWKLALWSQLWPLESDRLQRQGVPSWFLVLVFEPEGQKWTWPRVPELGPKRHGATLGPW